MLYTYILYPRSALCMIIALMLAHSLHSRFPATHSHPRYQHVTVPLVHARVAQTQGHKDRKTKNTQTHKQTSKHASKQTNKQTHKQTNLTNNQSHTHTNDSENKHRLEASYASARQPSTAQILKAVLHNVW